MEKKQRELELEIANEERKIKSIEKRIKSGKEQADNIILEIPDRVPRHIIHNTIHNYFKNSHTDRIILVIHQGKLLYYKK